MVYESLITIIEKHLEDLTSNWSEEVNNTSYMQTYKKLNNDELRQRGKTLFSNLLNWLLKGASNDDAAKYFREVGVSRIKEGFPLSEVYYALYLEKKILWNFVAEKDETSECLTAADAIEYMSVINNYFDLGDFYIIKGYHEEMYNELISKNKFTKEELSNFFNNAALVDESAIEIKEQLFGEGLSLNKIK